MASRDLALGLMGLANTLQGGIEGYKESRKWNQKLAEQQRDIEKEQRLAKHQQKIEELATGKTMEPVTDAMKEIYKRASLPIPTGSTVDAQEAASARALAIQQSNPALAETKRHNLEIEKATASKTKTEKYPSAFEFNARGFANKAAQANKTLEDAFAKGYNPSSAESGMSSIIPNPLKSSLQQQAEQAHSQFLNAVLRDESGAAVPESEYPRYFKTYIPQFGDAKATLDRKKKAREQAISDLKTKAGRARILSSGEKSMNEYGDDEIKNLLGL